MVRLVAQAAPWLAPVPSAYFVARSGIVHLDLPVWVAAICAAIIESLGLSSVHILLKCRHWNQTKRKADPPAPTWLATALALWYLIATLGLVVFLEVWPILATYAPALFPALAVVGTVNLVMIAQQQEREREQEADRKRLREQRHAARKMPVSHSDNGSSRGKGYPDWQSFLAAFPDMLEMTGQEIGRIARVSTRTGNNWKVRVRESLQERHNH